MKKHLKWLKEYIIKNYGEACKDFDINCYTCQKWLAYDILCDCIYDKEGL